LFILFHRAHQHERQSKDVIVFAAGGSFAVLALSIMVYSALLGLLP